MLAECESDDAVVCGDPASRATVLVVEDTPEVLNLVECILHANGYSVLRAGNGSEALAVARAHHGPIMLLLTDVSISDIPGPEVARQLLAAHKTSKVLFMSGAVSQSANYELGAVIPKPFTISGLLETVRIAIDRG